MGWVAEWLLTIGNRDKLTLGTRRSAFYALPMAQTQHSFVNRKEGPIYVSVEPWPECFELEPGDRLTLIWDASENGDAITIDFINDHELVAWPNGETHQMQYLINGEEAEDRSWTFKHR